MAFPRPVHILGPKLEAFNSTHNLPDIKKVKVCRTGCLILNKNKITEPIWIKLNKLVNNHINLSDTGTVLSQLLIMF